MKLRHTYLKDTHTTRVQVCLENGDKRGGIEHSSWANTYEPTEERAISEPEKALLLENMRTAYNIRCQYI